jgi:hypothetical protein
MFKKWVGLDLAGAKAHQSNARPEAKRGLDNPSLLEKVIAGLIEAVKSGRGKPGAAMIARG